MTNDQINTAIARKLGIPLVETKWKFTYWSYGSQQRSVPSCGYRSEEDARSEMRHLEREHNFICSEPVSYEENVAAPDFCNSLDACRVAEDALTEGQEIKYVHHLSDILEWHSWPKYESSCFALTHATAQQRALAMCKTWGLGE